MKNKPAIPSSHCPTSVLSFWEKHNIDTCQDKMRTTRGTCQEHALLSIFSCAGGSWLEFMGVCGSSEGHFSPDCVCCECCETCFTLSLNDFSFVHKIKLHFTRMACAIAATAMVHSAGLQSSQECNTPETMNSQSQSENKNKVGAMHHSSWFSVLQGVARSI